MVRLCRTKVWRPSHRNFMQSSKTTTIRANSSRVAWTCNHRVRRYGIAGPVLPLAIAPTASPLRLERVGGTAVRCAAHLAPRCGRRSQVRPSDGTPWHFRASEQNHSRTEGGKCLRSTGTPRGPASESLPLPRPLGPPRGCFQSIRTVCPSRMFPFKLKLALAHGRFLALAPREQRLPAIGTLT